MPIQDLELEKKALAKEYKELLKISYQSLNKDDKKLIRKAFDYAVDAHQHQRRLSGEAYIFHPIAVAKIVASEIGLDAVSIASALIHDVVEDNNDHSLEKIKKEFGAKILMTACYEPKQMITACALKADYVAPYFGRMMDAGLDAMANMKIIEKIARKNKCIPVIASLRNAKQILEIAEIGHDCFTISPEVARDLFNSKLTDGAAIAFEEAAMWDNK